VLGVMLAAASTELMRAGVGGLVPSRGASTGGGSGDVSGAVSSGSEGGGGGDSGGGGGENGGDGGSALTGSRNGGENRGGTAAVSGSGVYVLIVTAAATVASKSTGVGCLFGFGGSLLAAGRERWSSRGGGGCTRVSRADKVEYSELS